MKDLDKTYIQTLETIKQTVKTAQIKAAVSVNSQLIMLYWEIGSIILKQQEEQGWGAKIIDQIAQDLKKEFPHMTGFSPRNLKYMRKFAEVYPTKEFVQQVAAQIPWAHSMLLLDKIKSPKQRLWYMQKIVEHGWSRNVLTHQIESGLYDRQALLENKSHNFGATLPKPQSDLAGELLKDPYNFEFLTIAHDAKERELEDGLVKHIIQFILELGKGFAFMGSQYHMEVGGQDFYIDLLFYNTRMHCYVPIELKMGDFKPEYAGKMNFYLSAIDDLIKSEKDNPSIGIILCKSKNRIITEYALKDMSKPMGISSYTLTQALTDELKASLPTTSEIEAELSDIE